MIKKLLQFISIFIILLFFTTCSVPESSTDSKKNDKTDTTLDTVESPTFSPVAGSYTNPQNIIISTTTTGAEIRYTTDGSDPSSSHGTIYTTSINIASTTTIKAIAYKSGMNDSSITSAIYTIIGTVAAPTFNPIGDTYSSPQNVTISTITAGSTIRYTTDGSDPSSSHGTIYTTAINIASTTTLKAIAYQSGMTDSDISSATYTIIEKVATPAFTPGGGSYSTAQNVAISTTTTGAEIRYTTDGSDPSTSHGTIYTTAINIASTTTLKAIAYKSGMADSDIISEIFIIDTSAVAQWAKSTDVGSDDSRYHKVAADSSGNIYVAGNIEGTSSFGFENSITTSGTYSGSTGNILITKYNSSGVTQWAKSVDSGSNYSHFNDIAIDSSGNIFAVGSFCGNSTFDFGNGVTVQTSFIGGRTIIVKYDSNGDAQWAKPMVIPSLGSEFNAVAVDSSGNIYAAGYMYGNSNNDFGNGAIVNGNSTSHNIVIVKYNSSGVAQWARSTYSGTGASMFKSLAVDSLGNVYAAGYIRGTSTFDFGNSKTVAGSNSSGVNENNIILVKYNSSGDAQWAKSAESGSEDSELVSLAIDSSNNIYGVGSIGNTTYDFGNSVIITGNTYNGAALLIKYNDSGVTQWAKTTVINKTTSGFRDLSIDSSNNVFAVGYISGTSEVYFSNSVYASGTSIGGSIVLVKYDNSGNAYWAKTTEVGPSTCSFSGVVTYSNNIYAVGSISGSGEYDFGNGITTSGAAHVASSTYLNNVVIVKYQD